MLYIFIPAFNEEQIIDQTLRALIYQFHNDKRRVPFEEYTLVLIDNCSTDQTQTVFTECCSKIKGVNFHIIEAQEKGVVAARRDGCNAAIDMFNINDADIFGFVDADTKVSMDWISQTLSLHHQGHDLLTTLGFFEDSFWLQTPQLANFYYKNVGDLFFSQRLLCQLQPLQQSKWTQNIYHTFYKPPADTCFSLSVMLYRKLGGYQRYFDSQGKEIFGETWNMLLSSLPNPIRSHIHPYAYYEASPRRLVHETIEFIEDSCYEEGMRDIREGISVPILQKFEDQMKNFDFSILQDYVGKFYILLPCLLDEQIFKQNKHFFCINHYKQIQIALEDLRHDQNVIVHMENVLQQVYQEHVKNLLSF